MPPTPLIHTLWAHGPARRAAGPFVVSFTEYRFNNYRDLPKIAVAGLRMRGWWPRLTGAVGLSLYYRPTRRTVGSISVWTDLEALHAFVARPFHVDIMRRYAPRGSIRSTTFSVPAGTPLDLAAVYDRGEARLASTAHLASK